MTAASKHRIAGATFATAAAGLGAVWLTGDPRAFGVVVSLAGVIVGAGLGRQEWRTSHPHGNAEAGLRAAAGSDITKAV